MIHFKFNIFSYIFLFLDDKLGIMNRTREKKL